MSGFLQEVDDLVDFGLDLVDAGDIVERDADRLRIDPLLLAAAQQASRHGALLAPEHPDVEGDEQQNRREGDQQVRQEPALLHQRCRTDAWLRPSISSRSRSSFAKVGRSVVNC